MTMSRTAMRQHQPSVKGRKVGKESGNVPLEMIPAVVAVSCGVGQLQTRKNKAKKQTVTLVQNA
jgi:hypothetical protein